MWIARHQQDISDRAWVILEPILPGQRGQWDGIAEDNRRFIIGVFWILRTGAPWRELLPSYGKWALYISDIAAGEIKAYGKESCR